jgi:Glycosyl transferase family 2
LRPVVAVPARNEAKRLPTLLSALAQQTWLFAANKLLDVVVVLNNCDDHSAEIVSVASTRHDGLRLHVVNVRFPPPWAHVGSARRLAMEWALNIGGPHSVLFSTDADAAPAADWIEATLRSISAGADLVGGHIIGDKGEEALLGKGFLRRATHHLEYVGLVNHLKSLLYPDPHDPWPRHGDHTGASLAVRGDVYRAVGGIPPISFREDVMFVTRAVARGYRLRHPLQVRVSVSARLEGRARGGMADCLKAWLAAEAAGQPQFVDDAAAVLARLVHRRHKRGALASTSGRRSIPLPGGCPIWLPREVADSCIRGHGKPIGIETAIRQMKHIIAASPDSIRVT